MDRRASLVVWLHLCACGPALDATPAAPPPSLTAAGPHLALPTDATHFAPAQIELSGSGVVSGEQIADIDACEGCHADVADQFQTSAHAFSSFNNPLYRFGIEGLRQRVGHTQSKVCAGCHDVALLVDGAMDRQVEPDDDRSHAGITCRVCHGIDAVRIDGNASYTLSTDPLALPTRDDADSVQRHRVAVEPLRDDRLCATCHRSFLSEASGNDHFLAGMDDFGAWRSSAYNRSGAGQLDDPVPAVGCRDCHMARETATLGDAAAGEDGRIASHRFLGGHTWLAAMRGDDAQLQRVREFLRGTVSVDVAAARTGRDDWSRPAELAEVRAGQALQFDVVVRNRGVGHAFPGGVRDAVDSWLSVEVQDADGKRIAATRDDATAHRFRVLMGDDRGRPQVLRNTEDFYEAIVDHTLAARGARVVRYAVDIPADLPEQALPLRVRVTLLHRSRNRAFQDAVCEASRSERGQAFARAQHSRIGVALDPCQPQPVSTVGERELWIGRGAPVPTDAGQEAVATPARRLYEHGLGLLAELPAEADRARSSLLQALRLVDADPEGAGVRRAQVAAALGAVYASAPCGPSAPPGWPSCEGRLAETLRWLDQAEADAPGHPAIANLRARAYKRRAHFPEAAHWLRAAAERAPQNAPVTRALATTLSGLGRHGDALEVARRGLSLVPRDDDLLRVQHRALVGLGLTTGVVDAARDAYEDHRRAARPTAMRAACIARDAECRQERLAVHAHRVPSATDSPVHGPTDERSSHGRH